MLTPLPLPPPVPPPFILPDLYFHFWLVSAFSLCNVLMRPIFFFITRCLDLSIFFMSPDMPTLDDDLISYPVTFLDPPIPISNFSFLICFSVFLVGTTRVSPAP